MVLDTFLLIEFRSPLASCQVLSEKLSQFLFQGFLALPAVTAVDPKTYRTLTIACKGWFWAINYWLSVKLNFPSSKFEENTILWGEVGGGEFSETCPPLLTVYQPDWVQISGELAVVVRYIPGSPDMVDKHLYGVQGG